MKNCTNKPFNELGLTQKITYVGSRVALFVQRLLDKLSNNLVVNTVVKATTGQTNEQIINEAVNMTQDIQNKQANQMQDQINIKRDYIKESQIQKNSAIYIFLESTIDDLVKKQTKLRTSPKRLLVAKNYLIAMKTAYGKHQEKLAAQRHFNKLSNMYRKLHETLKASLAEKMELDMAIKKTEKTIESFRNEHPEIAGPIDAELNKSTESKPVQENTDLGVQVVTPPSIGQSNESFKLPSVAPINVEPGQGGLVSSPDVLANYGLNPEVANFRFGTPGTDPEGDKIYKI